MSKVQLRALEVLEFLARNSEGASLADVTRQTGMNRATAHRLLGELVASGWVCAEGSPRRFSKSLRAFELGILDTHQTHVREVLFAQAVRLSRATSKSCTISFYEGGAVMFIDSIQVIEGSVVTRLLGVRTPAAATSPGKAFLASMPPDEAATIASRGLPSIACRTKRLPEEIEGEIQMARERGYGYAEQEAMDTTAGVAMVVVDGHGQAVGALSVGTTIPVEAGYPENVVRQLRHSVDQASRELGYRGPLRRIVS